MTDESRGNLETNYKARVERLIETYDERLDDALDLDDKEERELEFIRAQWDTDIELKALAVKVLAEIAYELADMNRRAGGRA
jgi:hypothetical protein